LTDYLTAHYFPALSAYISRFGSQEGGASIEEARALNDKYLNQADEQPWLLPYVQAAFRAWWLAEYSSWYGEHYDGSLPQSQLDEGQ
jgi:nuclear pore complex protein Nup205